MTLYLMRLKPYLPCDFSLVIKQAISSLVVDAKNMSNFLTLKRGHDTLPDATETRPESESDENVTPNLSYYFNTQWLIDVNIFHSLS